MDPSNGHSGKWSQWLVSYSDSAISQDRATGSSHPREGLTEPGTHSNCGLAPVSGHQYQGEAEPSSRQQEVESKLAREIQCCRLNNSGSSFTARNQPELQLNERKVCWSYSLPNSKAIAGLLGLINLDRDSCLHTLSTGDSRDMH